MKNKKRILLKLTGNVLRPANEHELSSKLILHIIDQIKELKDNHSFDALGIVIGGGNILRGEQQGKQMGLSPSVGHQVGMIATIINGIILKDLFEQKDLPVTLLSSIVCPQICDTISQEKIDMAIKKENIIIFAGGTGAPFFTTDTNAIIRALQIGATEVWKATDVDGIYSSDPNLDKNATILKKIKYSDAISQKLGIIDTTALTLTEKHAITVRVFNIFEKEALLKAEQDQNFGSLII